MNLNLKAMGKVLIYHMNMMFIYNFIKLLDEQLSLTILTQC